MGHVLQTGRGICGGHGGAESNRPISETARQTQAPLPVWILESVLGNESTQRSLRARAVCVRCVCGVHVSLRGYQTGKVKEMRVCARVDASDVEKQKNQS